MALPGLSGSNDVPVEEEIPTIVHELQPQTEWRFEVDFGQSIEVTLQSGTAELFGTELAPNRSYRFAGRKAALYTWHGARLAVRGRAAIDYVADETPVASYANLHFALDELRSAAAAANTLGPRVLVVGPAHAGKTSLVQLLAAYAGRAGHVPVVVDTDPAEGRLALPGALAAVALDSVLDVEDGWGSSPTSGPQHLPVKLPLVYAYGAADPDARPALFKPAARRLALAVRARMEAEPRVKSAGCVIDSAASVSAGRKDYDIVQHLVAEFQVNVMVILGSERLYSDMSRRFAKPVAAGALSVVKLDRSGGCVDRDATYLRQARQAAVRAYFFGDPARAALAPHTQFVDFDAVTIYRPTEHTANLAHLLPGADPDDPGTDHTTDPAAPAADELLERVEPGPELQHALLAVLAAPSPSSRPGGTGGGGGAEAVLRAGAATLGFVHVADVDVRRRRLRVLAPMGGRLPGGVLLWGRWPPDVGELLG